MLQHDLVSYPLLIRSFYRPSNDVSSRVLTRALNIINAAPQNQRFSFNFEQQKKKRRKEEKKIKTTRSENDRKKSRREEFESEQKKGDGPYRKWPRLDHPRIVTTRLVVAVERCEEASTREREREKTGGEGGEKLTEKEGRKERRQGGKRRALLSRERHA